VFPNNRAAIIARRLLNHSTRRRLSVYASSPYQRPPCLPVYTTLGFLSVPDLLCSSQTTPPSLANTPPPHRQTQSLKGGFSQATGEDVRLQARYVSSQPISITRKKIRSPAISMAVILNGKLDRTRTKLTIPRWAQGACCIRQDHSPCVEAVLRP